MPSPKVTAIPIDRVTYETLTWVPPAPAMYSRAEVARQTGQFDAAVPARIAGWDPEVSAGDIADLDDATRAIVAFDSHAAQLLGRDNEVLGPLSASLLRTESASSSQIEQLDASAKQVALAEIGESSSATALTVVGNVRAMESALMGTHPVDVTAILGIHRVLMTHQQGFDQREAGRVRTQQVWIGPGDAGPLQADFVAPHHPRLAEALSDLEKFLAREDLPVLLQVAVSHAQFETIHPFVDGNGRTGRALAQLVLRSKGVLEATAFPLSAGLLVDVDSYFQALGAFREGDAGPIVRVFARASRIASVTGTKLVEDVMAELEDSRDRMAGIRADSSAWKVLPVLMGQPVVTVRYLQDKLGLGEMSALRALETLTARGVVEETTGRKRGRVWQHSGVLGLLDVFARTIRKMTPH